MDLELPPTLSDRRRQLLTSAAAALDAEYRQGLLGLVLSGSAGHGLETSASDLDLLIVLEPGLADSGRVQWLQSAELEAIPLTLEHLQTVASFDDDQWAYRWSYAWAPVLADQTGGRIADAVDRQTHLTAAETNSLLVQHERLGTWINLTYRALKSARDAHLLEAQLDASEAIPAFLDVVFALDGLVRPYNKYLPWALRHHPLRDWPADDLLDLLDRMRQGDAAALRHGFARVHDVARRSDRQHGQIAFGDVFDEWADEPYRAVLGLP